VSSLVRVIQVEEYFQEAEDWIQGQGAWLGRKFYQADKNSDDRLSPDEVGGLLQEWIREVILKDAAQNEARRLFEKYDADKNGFLELEEFKALGREMGVRFKCFLMGESGIQQKIYSKRRTRTEPSAAGDSAAESAPLMQIEEPSEKRPRTASEPPAKAESGSGQAAAAAAAAASSATAPASDGGGSTTTVAAAQPAASDAAAQATTASGATAAANPS